MEAIRIRTGSVQGAPALLRRLDASGAGQGIRMPAEVKTHFRELRESLRSGTSDDVKRSQRELATSLSSSLRGQGVPEPDIQSVLSSIGQLKAQGQRGPIPGRSSEAPLLASPSSNPLLGAYQRAIAPAQTRGYLMDALA